MRTTTNFEIYGVEWTSFKGSQSIQFSYLACGCTAAIEAASRSILCGVACHISTPAHAIITPLSVLTQYQATKVESVPKLR